MTKVQFMRRPTRIYLLMLLLVVLFANNAKSQDAPVYEQYAFDNSLINPSFTGLVDVMHVKVAHRQQWIGYGSNHTPSTSFVMFRTRLKERNGGIGGFLYTDKNGANSQTGMQVNASFHYLLRTKRTTRTILSFGFGATVFMHTFDESRFDRDIYDPIVTYGSKNYFGYDANCGVLFTHGGFLAGVSFNRLLQWTCPVYDYGRERVIGVNMNVHVGKIFWLTNQMQIAPLVIYKSNMRNMNQLDLGFHMKFLSGKKINTIYTKEENEIILGLTYKQTLDVGNISPLSISPMVGVVFKGFSLSYLCDLSLTRLQKYNYGTHQILLGYRLYRDKHTTLGKHEIASMVYEF